MFGVFGSERRKEEKEYREGERGSGGGKEEGVGGERVRG